MLLSRDQRERLLGYCNSQNALKIKACGPDLYRKFLDSRNDRDCL